MYGFCFLSNHPFQKLLPFTSTHQIKALMRQRALCVLWVCCVRVGIGSQPRGPHPHGFALKFNHVNTDSQK